jgi:hypothetical protein
MKPFNEAEMRAGRTVVSNVGGLVTELVKYETRKGTRYAGMLDGWLCVFRENELFMAPEKKSGWVNVYPNSFVPYRTKEAADDHALYRIACAEFSWEE